MKTITIVTAGLCLLTTVAFAQPKEKNTQNYTTYDRQYRVKEYFKDGKIYDRDGTLKGYYKEDSQGNGTIYDRGYGVKGYYKSNKDYGERHGK